MSLYPPIRFVLLNGFLLTLPMMVLRFGIPALLNKDALPELAYFPPVEGQEKIALKVYFISNTFLLFSPLLSAIESNGYLGTAGWTIHLVGVILLGISLFDYCRQEGLKTKGIYRYSRNPMCVGFFLIFLGTALLISSWFHLVLAVIYQLAVHWLILSEERWCLESFGPDFQDYCINVPRYFIF